MSKVTTMAGALLLVNGYKLLESVEHRQPPTTTQTPEGEYHRATREQIAAAKARGREERKR